jgi:hypothetical protein
MQILLSHGCIACVVCALSRGGVLTFSDLQKKKNTLSGTEFQRTKEAQAAIMRQKQEAGEKQQNGMRSASANTVPL